MFTLFTKLNFQSWEISGGSIELTWKKTNAFGLFLQDSSALPSDSSQDL